MTFSIDLVWLAAAFLIAIRIAPLFVLAPVFGTADIPVRFRLMLSLSFAALFATAIGAGATSDDALALASGGALFAAAIREFAIGLVLAFGVFTAFAAFLFGGRLLDIQIGFGIANVFDPVTRSQGPLLGSALAMLAIVVFFAVDGHHMLLRGFAWSLERLPPGRSWTTLDARAVVEQFGIVFAYGLAVVAPSVILLLLLDVGMAVAARTMPQMNIFIVAMPIKVVVGILTLALSMRFLAPTLARIYESIGAYWQRVLA